MKELRTLILWPIAWILSALIDWKFNLYPQTWYWVTGDVGWQGHVRKICGRIGHELSDTEYGYGGGGIVDRWCRWCGINIKVRAVDEPDFVRSLDSSLKREIDQNWKEVSK